MQKVIYIIIALIIVGAGVYLWQTNSSSIMSMAQNEASALPAAEDLVGGNQQAAQQAAADFTPADPEPREIASGLAIQELIVGTGTEATTGKAVAVHYVGTLTDGQVFDTSLQEGRTAFVFQLGGKQVIQGWDLGVVGMKVGGVRRLIVAPEMGYGAQQVGPIPPNSTLVFNVQLLEVGDAVMSIALGGGVMGLIARGVVGRCSPCLRRRMRSHMCRHR